MKNLQTAFSISILVVISFCSPLLGQEGICKYCIPLAASGFIKSEAFRESIDKKETFAYTMCKSDYGTFLKNVQTLVSDNANLSVIIPTEIPIPVQGGNNYSNQFTDQQFSQWKTSHCEAINSNMSDERFLEKIRSSPDKEAMGMYLECIKVCSDRTTSYVGITKTANDENNITIRINFTAIGKVNRAVVTETVYLPPGVVVQGKSNTDLNKSILVKQGDVIEGGGTQIPLDTSQRKEGFTLTVKTDVGNNSIFIPSKTVNCNQPECKIDFVKIKSVELTGSLAYVQIDGDPNNYVILLKDTPATSKAGEHAQLMVDALLLAYQYNWDVKIFWDGLAGSSRIVRAVKVPADK